jgi:NAD kinase
VNVGEHCKHGHTSGRYIDGRCIECKKAQDRKYAIKNADSLAQKQKVYRSKVTKEERNEYHKEIYSLNGEKYREKRRALRLSKKLKAIEFLGGKCVHCDGVFHQAAFDFHHVDPSVKENNLGTLMNYNWDIVQKELSKCILLCRNCHSIFHYEDTLSKIERKKIREVDTR